MTPRVTRKQFLTQTGRALAGAGLSARLGAAPHQAQTDGRLARRPNILMILTDQERSWETLPERLELPVRRSFAERATSFTNHHITTLPCGPSRSAIMTGQHVQRTRVTENPSPFTFGRPLDPSRTPTIGNMLQAEGYYTAYKGKWHLSTSMDPDDYPGALRPHGFDEANEYGEPPGSFQAGSTFDDTIAGTARDFLLTRPGQLDDDRPWFLVVSLVNPHDIMWFDATGEQQGTRLVEDFVSEMSTAPDHPPYNEDLGFDLPASYADSLAQRPDVQRQYVAQAQYFYGELARDNEEAFRRVQNYYFNCLRDGDRHIGTVLQALDASGHADNTVVVLTSDHGEMAGAHRLRNKGPFLYRENLNVPFVVRHPDVAAGSRAPALMSSVDIAPTILAVAGVPADRIRDQYPDLEGYDLTDVLQSPDSPGSRAERMGAILFNFTNTRTVNPRRFREELEHIRAGTRPAMPFPYDTIQFELRNFGRGLFDGRYKFARWFSPGDHHRPENWITLAARNDLELYDVETDPDERQNLALEMESHWELLLRLNEHLNRLIDAEVGTDDGSHMPGDLGFWRG